MRGIKRKFAEDSFQHIYQNTIGGSLIFYTREDRLVYLTLFSVVAKEKGVVVIGLALMYDHIHSLIDTTTRRNMSLFIGEVTSRFVLASNRDSGRHGPLFKKAFGNAAKTTPKKIRTCAIYLFNNSVEKKLFARAEQDRWNLLAYLGSDHPFSAPLDRRKASNKMKRAIREVDAFVDQNLPLSYPQLRRLYNGLNPDEEEQLTDYIISQYLPIDKERLLSFFKSIDDLVIAVNANTGSEYDLKEDFDADSHQVYREMIDLVKQSSFSNNIKQILTLPDERKKEIGEILMHRVQAKWYQIRKFLQF